MTSIPRFPPPLDPDGEERRRRYITDQHTAAMRRINEDERATMKLVGRIPPSPLHRKPPLTTDGPNDDLQAAQIELMHSISRLAVATFANDLVNRANDAQLYEFANIITNALHDYSNTGR